MLNAQKCITSILVRNSLVCESIRIVINVLLTISTLYVPWMEVKPELFGAQK